MKEDTVRVFAEWLCDRDDLQAFLHNLYHHPKPNQARPIGDWVFPFRWEKTDEGKKYWTEVSIGWRKYCRENKLL